MPDEIKKVVCPHCGGETEHFCSRITEGFLLKDEYTLRCSVCGQQESRKQQAGHRIADRDYPQKTSCPFCGRPSDEHAEGLSFGVISRLICQREGEAGSLRIPEGSSKGPAAGLRVAPRESRAAGIAPPPRARRKTVGTAKTMKPVTSRDITKIMIVFTLLSSLIIGAAIFIARVNDGTPSTTALYVGLTTAALIIMVMIFISILIIRDFRERFKESLQQRE